MALVALADAISAPQTGLLRDFSFEITAKDANVLVSLRPLIPAGTMVSITYLLTETDEARVAAARAVRQAGFTPLPHVAARRIASPGELRRFIDAMVGEADVDRLFIIAGDVPTPAGPFADSLAVIEQAPLRALGIRSVGIGGYPEGHPGIASATLERAMVAKLRALAEQGLGAEIMTQFAFDSDAMVAWVARLRTLGIHNRIRLGLPGPANVGTLLRFARRCGVGASAKVMTRYGASITKLLSTAGPDRLYQDLASQLAPATHGAVAIHMFPFGGLQKMAEWTRENAGN